jgi:hypothetical protein
MKHAFQHLSESSGETHIAWEAAISRRDQRGAAGLESGGIAPVSGIYRANHGDCSQRDLWIRKGERFPVCPHCGEHSVFLLDQEVEHIFEDPDFE